MRSILALHFLAAVLAASPCLAGSDPRLEAAVGDSLSRYIDEGLQGSVVEYLPEEVQFIPGYVHELVMAYPDKLSEERLNIVCTGCIAFAGTIFGLMDLGLDPEVVSNTIKEACIKTEIFPDDVCSGTIDAYYPSLVYMYNNTEGFDANRFCGIILGGDCGSAQELNSWEVTVPDGKPPVEQPKMPDANSPTLKVLQLSDIHLDLAYDENAVDSDCDNQPVCCRTGVGSVSDTVRHWGGAECGTPVWTFKDMLKQIAENHQDIDYIVVTGDYPPHDLWAQTMDSNLDHANETVRAILEAFPTTPVFPSMGNHEPHPCNNFPTSTSGVGPEHSVSGFYNEMATLYSNWLDNSALDMFRKDGFYSTLIRPGLRAIGMNSVFQYTANFWLNHHWEDPAGQLAWLSTELLEAEKNGEKVHIVSHIPMGGADTMGGWGKQFARIIERFENTVVAQYYGHTHHDEFVVFYDSTSRRPTNIAFVTPSVATWTNFNPSYRIFTIDGGYDGASYRVIDIDTYITDLEVANETPEQSPVYFKLYNTREDLDMANLFPAEWHLLARRLVHDEDLYAKFLTYWASNGGRTPSNNDTLICSLVSPSNMDKTVCESVLYGPDPAFDSAADVLPSAALLIASLLMLAVRR